MVVGIVHPTIVGASLLPSSGEVRHRPGTRLAAAVVWVGRLILARVVGRGGLGGSGGGQRLGLGLGLGLHGAFPAKGGKSATDHGPTREGARVAR